LAVDHDSTLFIYIVEGTGYHGKPATRVESRRAVRFGEGDEFTVRAGSEGMRFVLCGGRPLREPIAWGGPIVMNTQEELDQAFAELDAGTFVRETARGEAIP
jgi:redox-sensitive bicupin YhaK (pirin superfamily)